MSSTIIGFRYGVAVEALRESRGKVSLDVAAAQFLRFVKVVSNYDIGELTDCAFYGREV